MIPPLFQRSRPRSERVALRDLGRDDGAPGLTYGALLRRTEDLAKRLLHRLRRKHLEGARVAILVEPSSAWVVATWATWRAGGCAVPLALAHPEPELEHVLDDSGAELLVASPGLRPRVAGLAERKGLPLLVLGEDADARGVPPTLDTLDDEAVALLLYTSGTTGRPKGVPLRHRHLRAQVETLVASWEWSTDDVILSVLPLHHVHGIVNVLCCALWSGAEARILPSFDAVGVWESFSGGDVTLFMAVPTLYRRLVEAWRDAPETDRRRWSEGAAGLRLTVSGSAALPETTLAEWEEITGHVLLERYGMTEIGMALSNPLHGRRIPGTVGRPLPGVEARIVGPSGVEVTQGQEGELEVRGPGVFDGYWQRPDATREAFTSDGFFRTGDVASSDGSGVYRILGRRSVDILKTGGEKVSALEVESVLRRHPAVADVAVVGLPDAEWGQCVTAAVELREGASLDLETLRAWARERLAVYKVPRRLEVLDELPRNALGKVVKPELAKSLVAS